MLSLRQSLRLTRRLIALLVDAAEVFQHPYVRRVDSRKGYRETRWIAYDLIRQRVCVCVYTERGNVIRVISLRKGNRREQSFYYRLITSARRRRKMPQSRTDWVAVDALTDQTIDYRHIPPLPVVFTDPVEVIVPRHRLMYTRRSSS
ncbi:MAG: BrnT family toxin [Thermaerobacter sp.]|nr:BrnT family toxin [Thermaerobacter sp.]